MVDLMMWLLIAALLLAAAIQSISYYQKAALGYQAKSDLDGLRTWVAAQTSMTTDIPTLANLQEALERGDLKMTSSSGTANTAILASSGQAYCIGVRAEGLTGNNVYYASSKNPSEIKVESSLPTDCGAPAEAMAVRSDAEIAVNFATLTWTEKSTLAGVRWLEMNASSNGQYLIGGSNMDDVYTSADGGSSWKKHNLGAARWWGAIISSDGKRLTASSNIGVYMSDNGGDTWTKANLPVGNWTRVAASADGTRIVVADYDVNGYLYTSNDSGITWTQRINTGDPSTQWQSLASSADGKTILAGGNLVGKMRISRDYGSTWSIVTALGNGDWHDADVSADGTKMITGEASGALYTSVDGGRTWNPGDMGGVLGWRGVTLSDDGKVMAAGQRSGYIYTSIDSGATWVKRADSSTGTWYAVASTSDGSKIILGKYTGTTFVGNYRSN